MIGDNAILEGAARVAKFSVAPTLDERELSSEGQRGVVDSMIAAGLFGAWIPKHFGGGGCGTLEVLLALETFGELGRDIGSSLVWAVHGLLCTAAVGSLGADSQKFTWLGKMASGEEMWGLPLCELEGSAHGTGRAKVTARRDGDSWVLNGTKSWCVNAPLATHILLTAETLSENQPLHTAFVVRTEDPGIHLLPSAHFMARTCPVADIVLQDCRVPAHAVLGEVYASQAQLLPLLVGIERTLCLAPWIGIMQHILQRALAFSRTAQYLARPRSQSQEFRHRFFEMKADIEQSWGLIYRATESLRFGQAPSVAESAVAKLYGAEAVCRIIEHARHVHGFLPEPCIDRAHREVGVLMALGAYELLPSIIADSMLGRR